MTKYWIYTDGHIHGPYLPDELVKKAYFTSACLICPEESLGHSSDDWKPADAFKDVTDALYAHKTAEEQFKPPQTETEEETHPETEKVFDVEDLKLIDKKPLTEKEKLDAIEETEKKLMLTKTEPLREKPQAFDPGFYEPKKTNAIEKNLQTDYASLVDELKKKLDETELKIQSYLEEFKKYTTQIGQTQTADKKAFTKFEETKILKQTPTREKIKEPGFIGTVEPSWIKNLKKNELLENIDLKSYFSVAESGVKTELPKVDEVVKIEEIKTEDFFKVSQTDTEKEKKEPLQKELKDEYETFLTDAEQSDKLPELPEIKKSGRQEKVEEIVAKPQRKEEIKLDFEEIFDKKSEPETLKHEEKPAASEAEKKLPVVEVPEPEKEIDIKDITISRISAEKPDIQKSPDTKTLPEESLQDKKPKDEILSIGKPEELDKDTPYAGDVQPEKKFSFSGEVAKSDEKKSEQTFREKLKIDKLALLFKKKTQEKPEPLAEKKEIAGEMEKTKVIPAGVSARSTMHVAKAIGDAKVTRTKPSKRKIKILAAVLAVMVIIVIAAAIIIFTTGDKPAETPDTAASEVSSEDITADLSADEQEPASSEQIPVASKEEVSEISDSENFIENFQPAGTQQEPSSKVSEMVDKAVGIVKDYSLGGGRGTISQWFNNAFASSASADYQQDWSATLLHNNSYVVEYRFLSRAEPVVYQFEVDVEKGGITRGINNSAIELLATVRPAIVESINIEETKETYEYTPENLPQIPLP